VNNHSYKYSTINQYDISLKELVILNVLVIRLVILDC